MTTPVHTAPRWPQRLLAFVGALLIAAAWGSVVQTQFNLHALTAFVDIPLRVRLLTTLHDLAGFGSLYALMLLVAWLPAFLVAMLLARHRWRAPRCMRWRRVSLSSSRSAPPMRRCRRRC
jgi:hypothetical protein